MRWLWRRFRELRFRDEIQLMTVTDDSFAPAPYPRIAYFLDRNGEIIDDDPILVRGRISPTQFVVSRRR